MRAIAFCESPFTDLSLRTSLPLILLAIWNLLVHSTTWQPEHNGGARHGVQWRCRTAIFIRVGGGADSQYRWCRKGLGLIEETRHGRAEWPHRVRLRPGDGQGLRMRRRPGGARGRRAHGLRIQGPLRGAINRINTVHSLLGAFMEPFRDVSTKRLGAYLDWFRWCRTFMATDSGAAERTVARQLANGVCRSRIRDMFNVLPPYMDYWAAPAA